ncbi:hypothetical protein OIU78_019666 [Salix suchowensis]|nr:hypothetical protein OIU78_019666 [Salix suchowensis]
MATNLDTLSFPLPQLLLAPLLFLLSHTVRNSPVNSARPMWRFATLATILLLSLPSHADSTGLWNSNGRKPLSKPSEFLAAHNKIRATHNLTKLSWNRVLARYARRWANRRVDDCKNLEHSPNSPFGENLFWGLRDHWNASEVVEFWGDEVRNYDPVTNECLGSSVCGHYTQIVWNTTQCVGCAHALCNNNEGHLFVCSYDPPGNIYYQGPFGGRFSKCIVCPPPSIQTSSTLSENRRGPSRDRRRDHTE